VTRSRVEPLERGNCLASPDLDILLRGLAVVVALVGAAFLYRALWWDRLWSADGTPPGTVDTTRLFAALDVGDLATGREQTIRLLDLARELIYPEYWMALGGDSAQAWPMAGRIAVSAPEPMQAGIEELLVSLRTARTNGASRSDNEIAATRILEHLLSPPRIKGDGKYGVGHDPDEITIHIYVMPPHVRSEDTAIEDLLDRIMTVDRDHWQAWGGEDGAIWTFDGSLIVQTRWANVRAITDILRDEWDAER